MPRTTHSREQPGNPLDPRVNRWIRDSVVSEDIAGATPTARTAVDLPEGSRKPIVISIKGWLRGVRSRSDTCVSVAQRFQECRCAMMTAITGASLAQILRSASRAPLHLPLARTSNSKYSSKSACSKTQAVHNAPRSLVCLRRLTRAAALSSHTDHGQSPSPREESTAAR